MTGKPGGAPVQAATKGNPCDATASRKVLGVAGEPVEREGRGESARRGLLDLQGLVAA